MSQTLFIADLHLSEHTPELNALLTGCLKNWQGTIDALYILGDFFDVWVGDDDDSEFIRSIKAQLKTFSARTPVYLMHGNRDFLLGSHFAAETGIQLLPARARLNLYGRDYVILHGDELCTDDLPYQQFRAQSRSPLWQAAMLSKPLAERRLLAGQIRQMSETRKNAEGKSEISDVTEAGIQTLMARFAADPMPTLIHGHTHRPAIHKHQYQGRPFRRYVLQDWYDQCGGYLQVDNQGVQTKPLSLP